jgi:hypothetical protein
VYASFMTESLGHELQYQAGEAIIAMAIRSASDGVVPFESAFFDGRKVRAIRFLDDYDHTEMWQEKPGDLTLFPMIKSDLMDSLKDLRPTKTPDFSPRTLGTVSMGQVQPITITGVGFTGTSLLTFNDGANSAYTDRVPASWTATQLTYNLAIGPNPATWTVKVVNNGVESLPYTFYVISGGSPKQLTGL